MNKFEYTITAKKNKEWDSSISQIRVASSQDALQAIKGIYDEKENINVLESFYVILLAGQNKMKGYALISQGGSDMVYVDVKLIAKYAIDTMARKLILVHNHPSGGYPEPSAQDKELTSRIKAALALFGIGILDHIIITDTGYYSFADTGNL